MATARLITMNLNQREMELIRNAISNLGNKDPYCVSVQKKFDNAIIESLLYSKPNNVTRADYRRIRRNK